MGAVCRNGHPMPTDYQYCGRCGNLLDDIRQSGDPGPQIFDGDFHGPTVNGPNSGTVIGADNHGPIFNGPTTFNEPRSDDPYAHRVEHARKRVKRSILPDNWVTASAGTCTVISFILTSETELFSVPKLGLVLSIIAMGSIVIFVTSAYLRWGLTSGKRLRVPFGGGTFYEKTSNGRVYRALLVFECPWCRSNGIRSSMTVHRSESGDFWRCEANPQQHFCGYDPTAFPPLEDASET